MLATLPTAVVTTPDERHVHIKRGDWEADLDLDNLAAECRGGAATCDAAIANAVANLHVAEGEHPVTTDKLVITLKTTDWFAQTDKMIRDKFPDKYEDNKLASQPVVGELVAVLGVDRPTGIEMVSGAQLRALGLDPAAAFATARGNLKTTHPKLALVKMEDTPVFTNNDDDDYIAATIVLPELWQPYAAQVKGDLLVAVPARNRVFATGTEEPGAVEGIGKIAALAFQSEPHALTGTILKWSSTGWTVHALP